MKSAPFALKSPFWLHGFLYVLAAHLTGYLIGELAFLLLPADWTHLPYLFSLGGCALSLPLFFLWFFRNENPIGYLAATVVSQLAVALAGTLLLIPMIYLADALTTDPDKMNPWSFFAIWLSVAVFFGALLILLCLGLLVYALIRRKSPPPPQKGKPLMKRADLTSPLRAHAASAGIGVLYSLLLHLAVWVSQSVCHLAIPANGNHLPKLFVPACIMLVGLVIFIVIKSAAAEPLTFYGVLLLTHILLALLMAQCIQPLADWLDALKGITPPPADEMPDGNLNGFYFMIQWVLLAVGMGILLFILSVAFYLRDVLRGVMGYIPKEKKRKDHND